MAQSLVIVIYKSTDIESVKKNEGQNWNIEE